MKLIDRYCLLILTKNYVIDAFLMVSNSASYHCHSVGVCSVLFLLKFDHELSRSHLLWDIYLSDAVDDHAT